MDSVTRIFQSSTEMIGLVKGTPKGEVKTEMQFLREKINEQKKRLDIHQGIIENKLKVPLSVASKKKKKIVLIFQIILDVIFITALFGACGYTLIRDYYDFATQKIQEINWALTDPDTIPWEYDVITEYELEKNGVGKKYFTDDELLEKVTIPATEEYPIEIHCLLYNYDEIIQFNDTDNSLEMNMYFVMDNVYPYNISQTFFAMQYIGTKNEVIMKQFSKKHEHIIGGEYMTENIENWGGFQFGHYFHTLSETKLEDIKNENSVSWNVQSSSIYTDKMNCGEFQLGEDPPAEKCIGYYGVILRTSKFYEDIEEYWGIVWYDPLTKLGGTISLVGTIVTVVNIICILAISKTYDISNIAKEKKKGKKEVEVELDNENSGVVIKTETKDLEQDEIIDALAQRILQLEKIVKDINSKGNGNVNEENTVVDVDDAEKEKEIVTI